MGTLNTQLINQASAITALRQRVDLLLAAYGKGALDPADLQHQIREATQDAIKAVLAKLDGLDVSEISLRADLSRKLIGLQNAYGPEKYFFEFFNPLFSACDVLNVAGATTVAGDDSVDISSTAKLMVGGEYVIDGRDKSVVISVSEILSATRFKASAAIKVSLKAGILRRTNWTIGSGEATAKPGQVYYSLPLDLGEGDVDKAVIIRRTDNASAIRLYFKDGTHAAWTEAPWAWKRDADTGITNLGIVADGTTDTGMIDVEYRLPARGAFDLKMVVEGGSVTVKHIVGIDQETLLGGTHHPPETPVNSHPADAATDVSETPTLDVKTYSSVISSPMAASQWQVSAHPVDWSSPVYDSSEGGGALAHQMPSGELLEDKTYHWRARLKDDRGTWSAWSAATSFTTADSFKYVVTPTITSPRNGDTDIPEQPTLHSSAFAVHGGKDAHVGSQWQIRAQKGTYATPVWNSVDDSVNLNVEMPAGLLKDGQKTYAVRVRHRGKTLGWSEWSSEVSFTTKDLFANIIGIALVTSGGGGGTWARVDKYGNNKATDTSFFNNHPVYSGIVDVTVDSQVMVKIPRFYYKVATAPAGSDHAGKKCWWISNHPQAGFQIHPAFMDEGSEIPYVYVGKYEATKDADTKAGSVSGVKPLACIDFNAMKARCAARNTGSVSGFRLWSIFEVAAIQMLALIEMGGADSQSLVGIGNINTSAAVNTGTTNAVWRGIRELWGNVFHMVDGLKTDTSNCLQVWDRKGNKTWVNTNVTITPSGWMVSALESTGTGFDFRDLFVAATVDGTSADGTFGDYHFRNSSGKEYVCYHGGSWCNGARSGLFNLNLRRTLSDTYSDVGGRLAKT